MLPDLKAVSLILMEKEMRPENWRENVELASMTTIGLGGRAKFFVEVDKTDELRDHLSAAKQHEIPVCILGGGSNTLFSDEPFPGLVLKISTQSLQRISDHQVKVDAGYDWDMFVKWAISKGHIGIEALSGIPGSVGGTPIQNVGAYGQEVSQVIEKVEVLDRANLEDKVLSAEECEFSYRSSRFKFRDRERFIVKAVQFKFLASQVQHKYRELADLIVAENPGFDSLDTKAQLTLTRDSVLKLRRSKSMVVDENDPNSRSLGSFFTNPIIEIDQVEHIKKYCDQQSIDRAPPIFPFEGRYKVSAAWLVENAGFSKGYSYKGVGVSESHCLALINRNGRTSELLELADSIRSEVLKVFKVELHREPVLVQKG